MSGISLRDGGRPSGGRRPRPSEVLVEEFGFTSIEDLLEACEGMDYIPGICLSCGSVYDDTEPDIRDGLCAVCGKHSLLSVYCLFGMDKED